MIIYNVEELWVTKLLATLAIILLSAVNACGLKYGKNMQISFAIIKCLMILLISITGILFATGVLPGVQKIDLDISDDNVSILTFGLGTYSALWAYEGW